MPAAPPHAAPISTPHSSFKRAREVVAKAEEEQVVKRARYEPPSEELTDASDYFDLTDAASIPLSAGASHRLLLFRLAVDLP